MCVVETDVLVVDGGTAGVTAALADNFCFLSGTITLLDDLAT